MVHSNTCRHARHVLRFFLVIFFLFSFFFLPFLPPSLPSCLSLASGCPLQHHLLKNNYHFSTELPSYLCKKKNQLTIYVWIDFWFLYSIPLINVPLLLPTTHCLNYYRFIRLQISYCEYNCYFSRLIWLF